MHLLANLHCDFLVLISPPNLPAHSFHPISSLCIPFDSRDAKLVTNDQLLVKKQWKEKHTH